MVDSPAHHCRFEDSKGCPDGAEARPCCRFAGLYSFQSGGPVSSADSSPHNTFIVRFWWELPAEGEARCWRGRIQHVQSGDGLSFQDACTLLTFIESFIPSLQLGTRGAGSPVETKGEKDE
jgi:hypothetical protein